MEGREPPDDDNPFEWTDAPAPPRRRYSERSFDTSEDERFETGERSFDTGEDPYETGERRRPSTEERETFDPGTRPGESRPEDPYRTWEREEAPAAPGADEPDPYDTTGERAYESDPYTTTSERAYDERERDRVRRRDRRRGRGDTGEYRRGRRLPGGGRPKRRDLPAKVRRRQDLMVGAVVVAVLVGGFVLLKGGGGGEGEEAFPVKKLAGQTIIAPMGEKGPDKKLLKAARKGQIGGVIAVKAQSPQSLKADVARIQKAARSGDNPTLLVMLDQEGGFVKELPGPPDTSPNDLGKSGDATAAQAEGQKTGAYLAPLGVNVNLAPVLDVTIPNQTADTIKTRTFGDDAAKVAELGSAFITAQQGAGVAATAKHFPGLGLSTINTDFGRTDVTATPEDQAAALVPFQAAVDAGVKVVMTSTAIYRSLNTSNPAVFSPSIVQGELRDKLGFDGAIITDDLDANGVTDITSPQQAAVNALKAGNDLLLFAQSGGSASGALRTVVKSIKAGKLPQATVQAAYDKVLELKSGLPAK